MLLLLGTNVCYAGIVRYFVLPQSGTAEGCTGTLCCYNLVQTWAVLVPGIGEDLLEDGEEYEGGHAGWDEGDACGHLVCETTYVWKRPTCV